MHCSNNEGVRAFVRVRFDDVYCYRSAFSTGLRVKFTRVSNLMQRFLFVFILCQRTLCDAGLWI